jgi:hypothetical protein
MLLKNPKNLMFPLNRLSHLFLCFRLNHLFLRFHLNPRYHLLLKNRLNLMCP